MDLLNELLLNKTTEELIEMYKDFRENGENLVAARLRSILICKEYFSSTAISEDLEYLIKEELKEIHYRYNHLSVDEWNIRHEYSETPFRDFTGINTLLLSKLHIEGRVVSNRPTVFYVRDQLPYELCMYGYDPFLIHLSHVIIEMFHWNRNTIEVGGSIQALIDSAQKGSPQLETLCSTFIEHGDLNPHYLKVEEWFESESKVEGDDLTRVREGILTLMVLYWLDGVQLETNLLLLKAMSITPETSNYYWVLKFIEKEFAENGIVAPDNVKEEINM